MHTKKLNDCLIKWHQQNDVLKMIANAIALTSYTMWKIAHRAPLSRRIMSTLLLLGPNAISGHLPWMLSMLDVLSILTIIFYCFFSLFHPHRIVSIQQISSPEGKNGNFYQSFKSPYHHHITIFADLTKIWQWIWSLSSEMSANIKWLVWFENMERHQRK